jgi:hypothetical protein
MSDNWEDWENEDFIIPVLSVPNEEQLKRLEERKLVEESDNALARELFSNDEEDLVYEELKKLEEKIISKKFQSTEKQAPIKNASGKQKENELKQKENELKQKENELKQKEFSKKNKEDKLRKEREKELYGKAEEDEEYSKYEDKFY